MPNLKKRYALLLSVEVDAGLALPAEVAEGIDMEGGSKKGATKKGGMIGAILCMVYMGQPRGMTSIVQ